MVEVEKAGPEAPARCRPPTHGRADQSPKVSAAAGVLELLSSGRHDCVMCAGAGVPLQERRCAMASREASSPTPLRYPLNANPSSRNFSKCILRPCVQACNDVGQQRAHVGYAAEGQDRRRRGRAARDGVRLLREA
jgi:hypothetical protein